MPESAFAESVLGRTGLRVRRLGTSAGYGVPAEAVERAFDAGVNYLYWGGTRREAFARALRNLKPQRDRMVLVVQSYARLAGLVGWSAERALRRLGFDAIDVLLLGAWSKRPSRAMVDAARKLKQRGLVRFLGLSTHSRPLIAQLAADPDFDLLHLRYNAVHTGAERDVFPHLPAENRPGLVSFTATNWKQLLGHRRSPKSERAPTASDCYRFVLARPEIDVCLTGPSNAAHVEEALTALERGPMSEEERAWMRRVGDAIYGRPRR